MQRRKVSVSCVDVPSLTLTHTYPDYGPCEHKSLLSMHHDCWHRLGVSVAASLGTSSVNHAAAANVTAGKAMSLAATLCNLLYM